MRRRESRFPVWIFLIILGTLLAAAGVNIGLVLLFERSIPVSPIVEVHVMVAYWLIVAAGLTLFVRGQTRKVYDEPLMRISEATRQVAKGDFTVDIPTVHSEDRYDYLDRMILDLNTMIAALGSIETLKTDFFSNVSHEIKTPLAVIQGSAELLLRQDLSSEQREQAETIFRQAKKLSGLIGNILKLNKLEKQVIVPATRRYDLCEQLAECALLFEDRWSDKDIEFEADMEDSCFVRADRGLTDLIWNNLMSNAVKFTEPGGSITLTQRTVGDTCVVSVSDTGCGMDEETVKHIFDKFYQGDTSHATEGNGLGMALAMRVAQLHGYGIEVESEKGRGTRFEVRVPLEGEMRQ